MGLWMRMFNAYTKDKEVTIMYSNCSVVLFSNYNSSIVVIAVHVHVIEHHSSETVITTLYWQ